MRQPKFKLKELVEVKMEKLTLFNQVGYVTGISMTNDTVSEPTWRYQLSGHVSEWTNEDQLDQVGNFELVKNQQGFGLVEAMVTLVIMSIILVGTMSLIRFTLLASATGDAKNSVSALVGSISGIALNPVSCTAAVTRGPQTYNPNSIRFDLPDGSVIAPLADLPTYGVFVDQFTYVNPSLFALNPDGSKVYFGTLMLTIATNREVLGPSKFAPRALGSIYFSVDASGIITQCGASVPPSVPQAPVVPQSVPPPSAPVASPEVVKACGDLGGKMSGLTCDLHECGRD